MKTGPTKAQIKQIVDVCRWGAEWQSGENADVDCGCRETVGHILACWLVQVGLLDECETAVGRDMIFDDEYLLRPARAITRSIEKMLRWEAKQKAK